MEPPLGGSTASWGPICSMAKSSPPSRKPVLSSRPGGKRTIH